MLDAGAVTALRTGAAAVLAAETLGRPDAGPRRSSAPASTGGRRRGRFSRAGASVALWDVDASARARRGGGARRDGRGVARGGARRGPLVTVTPGHEVLLRRRSLAAGPAREPDGRGRAWEGGDRRDRARADAHLLRRLGAGEPRRRAGARGRGGSSARGTSTGSATCSTARRGPPGGDEITAFDSTGLAIQDLAIALAALERARELELAFAL